MPPYHYNYIICSWSLSQLTTREPVYYYNAPLPPNHCHLSPLNVISFSFFTGHVSFPRSIHLCTELVYKSSHLKSTTSWKVMPNHFGPWKSRKLHSLVLDNAWIMICFRLRLIYRVGVCHSAFKPFRTLTYLKYNKCIFCICFYGLRLCYPWI